MEIKEIIELVALGLSIIGLVASIVSSIAKGKMRDFIVQTMEEAEASGASGKEKLEYVVAKAKEKYKLAVLLMDIRAFIEKVIAASKKINHK